MEASDTGMEDIKSVKAHFEEWRRTKASPKCQIPLELWDRALKLTPRYSVSKISRALGLNYTAFKSHIEGKRSFGPTVLRKVAGFLSTIGSINTYYAE